MGEKNAGESLLSTWATTQQQVLTGWLDIVQAPEKPSRAVAWNETVSAWQSAVLETLEAQARWLRDWTGRVQVTSGSPTELRKNVQETQLLLLRWTEAQQHLWQNWFSLVQQIGPLLEADFQGDEHLFSMLRLSGMNIVNAQAEWVQCWAANLLNQ